MIDLIMEALNELVDEKLRIDRQRVTFRDSPEWHEGNQKRRQAIVEKLDTALSRYIDKHLETVRIEQSLLR